MRSELAGYFLSLLTVEGDDTLVTKGISLKEKMRESLKNKLIEYCPDYYSSFYKNAANTNSASSTESDDSSTPENQQKPKSKQGRRKPEFFHQDGNYCEMKPKKKARTKSKPRKSKFDQDKEEELKLGRIYFDDAKFYSSLTFIQYVDMNTRNKEDPAPKVIQEEKSIQKNMRNIGLGIVRISTSKTLLLYYTQTS